MDRGDLERRTLTFAIDVIRFVGSFGKSKPSDVISYQLLRSGTSIGANYREANRAESRRDFAHKIGLAEKECAETQYWLEICQGIDIGADEEVSRFSGETEELLSILVTIGRKARRKPPKNEK